MIKSFHEYIFVSGLGHKKELFSWSGLCEQMPSKSSIKGEILMLRFSWPGAQKHSAAPLYHGMAQRAARLKDDAFASDSHLQKREVLSTRVALTISFINHSRSVINKPFAPTSHLISRFGIGSKSARIRSLNNETSHTHQR